MAQKQHYYINTPIGTTPVTYTRRADLTISADNTLTLTPSAQSTPITIPAASGGSAGVTTVNITGVITA